MIPWLYYFNNCDIPLIFYWGCNADLNLIFQYFKILTVIKDHFAYLFSFWVKSIILSCPLSGVMIIVFVISNLHMYFGIFKWLIRYLLPLGACWKFWLVSAITWAQTFNWLHFMTCNVAS